MPQHKLLILGSTSEFSPLVNRARERGIATVACDGYPNGPAKALADERFDVSVYDHDAIAEVCHRTGVDGIITAFSDNLAEQASIIAEKAGLPFYLPSARLAILRDKTRMKAMFDELGVPYPRTAVVRRQSVREDLSALSFPVVTKPLNGWGSRGVYLLDTPDQVVERFDEVAGYSSADSIIVEEYNDGFELNMMSWVVDGEPIVLEIADREKTSAVPPAIPHVSRIVYPSILIDSVIGEAREMARHVARYVGLENGPLCMQFFWRPSRGIQVCECAGRVFGTEHEMLEYATYGRLAVEDLLIDTVYEPERLGERLAGHDPHLDRVACGLFFHGREGRISAIEGVPVPEADHRIVDTLLYYSAGDDIRHGAQPYVMRTYLAAESRQELDELTDEINASFSVCDEDGSSLLLHNERMVYGDASDEER